MINYGFILFPKQSHQSASWTSRCCIQREVELLPCQKATCAIFIWGRLSAQGFSAHQKFDILVVSNMQKSCLKSCYVRLTVRFPREGSLPLVGSGTFGSRLSEISGFLDSEHGLGVTILEFHAERKFTLGLIRQCIKEGLPPSVILAISYRENRDIWIPNCAVCTTNSWKQKLWWRWCWWRKWSVEND